MTSGKLKMTWWWCILHIWAYGIFNQPYSMQCSIWTCSETFLFFHFEPIQEKSKEQKVNGCDGKKCMGLKTCHFKSISNHFVVIISISICFIVAEKLFRTSYFYWKCVNRSKHHNGNISSEILNCMWVDAKLMFVILFLRNPWGV